MVDGRWSPPRPWTIDYRLNQERHLLLSRRELLAERRLENLLRQSEVYVADPVVRLRVHAALYPAAGDEHRETVALVRVGFGVLVHEHARGVVEQVAFAFGNRLQALEHVGKLLDVPPGDVAHDALLLRRPRVGMRIVVMAVVRMHRPREPGR